MPIFNKLLTRLPFRRWNGPLCWCARLLFFIFSLSFSHTISFFFCADSCNRNTCIWKMLKLWSYFCVGESYRKSSDVRSIIQCNIIIQCNEWCQLLLIISEVHIFFYSIFIFFTHACSFDSLIQSVLFIVPYMYMLNLASSLIRFHSIVEKLKTKWFCTFRTRTMHKCQKHIFTKTNKPK